MINDELFDLLVEIGIITVNDLDNLAKIRAYIARLQQEIADAKTATALALEQVAASVEVVNAAQEAATNAQLLADQAKEAQRVVEEVFAADQASDAELTAGLADLAASIPE